MKPYSILVISRGKASLARMFQGYMQSIESEKVLVAVASTDFRTIHPLALDVMAEDEIALDQNLTLDFQKYNLASFDLVVILGELSAAVMEKLNQIQFQQFKITDPLKANSYNNTLEAYRMAREEIKKICHNLVAAFSSSNS